VTDGNKMHPALEIYCSINL